ncbi:MAG: fimbrillin family protein [Rikenellaceae bacterium]
MKRVIYIIGIALVAIGCTEESGDSSLAQSEEVNFSTVSAVTRVVTSNSTTTSSAWETDSDKIGINSDNGDSNVEYYVSAIDAASATATFSPVDSDKAIYLSQSKEVNYSAYYPYQEGSTSIYTSNISTQSNLGDIDFLVSNILSASYASNNKSVSFTFTHALAMVKFNIILAQDLKDAYPDYENDFKDYTTLKLSNVATEVGYNHDGSCVGGKGSVTTGEITVPVDATDKTATAILNPTGSEQSMTLNITFDTKVYEQALSITPAANTIYEYSITLGYDEITISNTPTITPWNSYNGGTATDLVDLTEITFGTPSHPFQILDADDLAAVGSGTYHNGTSEPWDPSAHYKVMNDFAITDNNVVGGFTFAGTAISSTNPFYGELDGGGYTISGITTFGTAIDMLGLIPYIAPNAKVHDLNIECTISASAIYLGGIAGSNEGTISNCRVSGSITNNITTTIYCGTGGIAGHNTYLIEQCVNSATVTGYWKVGGIVGYLDLSSIISCGNTGEVINNTDNSGSSYQSQHGTGGIAGSGDGSTYILCCYNNGVVSSSGYMVGGVAGYTNGTVVRGSYNTGSVSSTTDHDYIGGVVGRVNSAGNVVSCYYLSTVATYGIGAVADIDGTVEAKDSDYMQHDDFVTILNTAAALTQTTYPGVTIYKWESGGTGQYPVTDIGEVVNQ